MKIQAISLLLCLQIVAASFSPDLCAQTRPDAREGEGTKSMDGSSLQFRWGGLILGYMPDRMYVVGFGYALIGEFVGAQKVMPVNKGRAGVRSTVSYSPQIIYREPWKGVTATFSMAGKGLACSRFEINPGADVASIKFHFNVDVALQKDGRLRYRWPDGQTFLWQAAPAAWQTMNGTKHRVEIAFKVNGSRTVGFDVGEYDSNYSLIIDPRQEAPARAQAPSVRDAAQRKQSTLSQSHVRGGR